MATLPILDSNPHTLLGGNVQLYLLKCANVLVINQGGKVLRVRAELVNGQAMLQHNCIKGMANFVQGTKRKDPCKPEVISGK
jgi:hypothetical protein